MTAVPLNALQKLFRSWETVYPYNAAQAVLVRRRLEERDVARAWNEALFALGLGPTQINCHSLSRLPFDPAAGGATAQLITPGVGLQDHLNDEINRPFTGEGEQWPFRPFLMTDEERSWLGMSYRHCIADSVSIRLLLREWLARLSLAATAERGLLKQSSDGYWDLFAARNGAVRLDQTLSTFIRGHHRLRSAQKPRTSGAADHPVRILLASAPDGLISELREKCRLRATRVSDVMLAALLSAARKHVPLQSRDNRRDVGVGCIVDLRPYASRSLEDCFGLYLGFTSVVCAPRDFASHSALLAKVARQTAMHRRRGIAAACTLWVHAGLALARLMPHHRLYHFYRKSMPLAAGLSSVRLRPTESFGPEVINYIRIAPTGPIAPAVLSTTEMNGQLSIALTYRPVVITEASAHALLDDFVKALHIS